MADKEINELTLASELDGTELLHVEQSSNSRQTTVDKIVAWFAAATRNLTVGYTSTAYDLGTVTTGTTTPDPANGNLQRMVNGGASTINAPTATGDYHLTLQVTNNASAGAITLSSFTVTDGDDFTTTDGDDFFLYITKLNGSTHATVKALQ